MASYLVPMEAGPLTADNEQRAINRLAVAVATLRHKFGAEYSREWLETKLCEGLREGWLSLATKAVAAANEGDNLADKALRLVGAELQTPMLQRRDLAPGHLQVIAYLQRVSVEARPLARRNRGRYAWYDHWVRDLGLCFLVRLACAEFGVDPTRNRRSLRANRNPSGISLMVAAAALNKIILDEKSFQNHLWHGLAGEMARLLPMPAAVQQ